MTILSVFFKGGEQEVFDGIMDDTMNSLTFTKLLQKHDKEVAMVQGLNAIRFYLPDGRQKYISAMDAGLIESLRKYPFSVIAQIFHPSEADMLQEINSKRIKLTTEAIELLKREWIDTSCGEIFPLSADYFQMLIGYKKTAKGILAMIDKIPTEKLQIIVDSFGEHSGLYSND